MEKRRIPRKNFAEGKQIGLIAQEVEKIFPELVNNSGKYKSVSYASIVAPLIEAIKELSDLITKMQSENARQNERIKSLELALQKLLAEDKP